MSGATMHREIEEIVSRWESFNFRVSCAVSEDYAIRVGAQVATVLQMCSGYAAYRVGDRNPIVVDGSGATIWADNPVGNRSQS